MQKFVASVQSYSLTSDIEQFVNEVSEVFRHAADSESLLGNLK